MASATSILAGFAATAIETTAPDVQVSWLFWLRVGGFLFILLDVIVFLRAKEYPYPQSEVQLKLGDIFVLPFRHKSFLRTMVLHSLITFSTAITASSWTYYLMDCGMNYSTLSFLSSITPIMALVLTPFALRLFKKMGCVNNMLLLRAAEVLVYVGYVFVIPATVRWLYPIVFIVFQILSVGTGVGNMHFVYLFMPEENRLAYYSFHYSTATVMGFLGSFLGAQFITLTVGRSFSFLGITLANVQLLMLLQALAFGLLILLFAAFRKGLAEEERCLAE